MPNAVMNELEKVNGWASSNGGGEEERRKTALGPLLLKTGQRVIEADSC